METRVGKGCIASWLPNSQMQARTTSPLGGKIWALTLHYVQPQEKHDLAGSRLNECRVQALRMCRRDSRGLQWYIHIELVLRFCVKRCPKTLNPKP